MPITLLSHTESPAFHLWQVSDFLEGRLSSEPLPPSSYRRGVVSAPLHELYPPPITAALRVALRRWGKAMSGFDGEQVASSR